MNIKKTVKKIAALGASAGMLGLTATAAFAVAPDLTDYPDFVMSNGAFDGRIVVGANAAAEDILGSIDIAASLQAASRSPVAGGGSATPGLTGDVAKIGESSDLLEIGEFVGDVIQSLTDDDLEMLQRGTITTQKGTTAFTQTLGLGGGDNANNKRVILAENNDDETAMYLFFNDGDEIFNYDLEFTSGLESDVESGVAEDLEDESIFMLGQYYTIVTATVDTNGDNLELEFIAGDVSDVLSVGQTRTYTVDGQTYEVTVLLIGTNNEVRLLVNGETTDTMSAGDTDVVAGIEVGVRDVLATQAYRESDPSSIVEFYLGANKITFDVAASATPGSVEINRENIEDASVTITYSDTVAAGDGTLRISSIEYSLDSDAASGTDLYLGEGDSLRDLLDEPEGMLNEQWDFQFVGLSEPSTSEIAFIPNGDDEYEVEFTNRRGDMFRVPYAYATAANAVKFGDEDDTFVFWEHHEDDGTDINATTFHITPDDYFVLTDGVNDNQGDSTVMQWEDIDTDDNQLTFADASTGQQIEELYTTLYVAGDLLAPGAALAPSGDISFSGQDFDFWVYTDGTSYFLAVDMDNDGDLAGSSINGSNTIDAQTVTPITVRGGGILELAESTDVPLPTGGDWTATLTTLGEDVDNDVAQVTELDFTTDAATELDVALGTSTGTFYEQSVDGQDLIRAVNGYGTMFEITDETSDADELTIMYPTEQVEALVYVVGGNVERSAADIVSTGASQVNILPVGLAVLDSDVTNADSTNHIVVGGPCANSISASLLGNPVDCAEGFEPGMGMIRTFDTGNNFAVLVAGYSARDTVQTSRVLARAATETVPGLAGTSAEVTIAGSNDVSVESAQ